MKSLLIFCTFLFGYISSAQTDSLPVADTLIKSDSIPKKWKLKAIYGLNGTQTSFVNWNAGGRNNVSLLGSISASANYEKDLEMDK